MLSLFRRAARHTIEPLRPEHAAACASIHAEGFAFPWHVSDFEAMIAAKACLCDALTSGREDSDEIDGFAISRLAADEAEILTIAVRAAQRGRGGGAMLLEAHLETLRRARAKRVFLEVNADNAAARALYARFSFGQVGERPGYYKLPGGARATALVLSKELA